MQVYKIGDRVRAISNCAAHGTVLSVAGKIGTIEDKINCETGGYWTVKLDEENKVYVFHESEIEKIPEQTTPKSLLRNGHIIRMRSGDNYICLMDNPLKTIIFVNKEYWEDDADYNDDLMLDPENAEMRKFDIMEIMEPKYGYDYLNALNGNSFNYNSIWKRPEDDFYQIAVAGVKFDKPIFYSGLSKTYLFQIPYTSVHDFHDIYKSGTKVIVETAYGNQIATVEFSKYFESKFEFEKFLKNYADATFPLKRVIGRINEVSWN